MDRLGQNRRELLKKINFYFTGEHMKRQLSALLTLLLTPALGAFWHDGAFQENIGPIFNFARYDIDGLPKIQGYLAGIHADIIHRYPSHYYMNAHFDGRWNAGFICGDLDLKSQIRDYRPELDLGYSFFSCNDEYIFTPITGLGFYYLSNELKPNVITNRYFNLYVPVGFDLLWRKKEHFQINLKATYRIDAWTRVKIKTPCETLCNKVDLKRTQGLHVELPMTWFLDKHLCCFPLHMKVVPFFDWNQFGRSDEANSQGICFAVPQLRRWYLGLHIDIGVRY